MHVTAFKNASGSESGFSCATKNARGALCHGWLTHELTGGMTLVMVAAHMDPGMFDRPPAQSRSTRSCSKMRNVQKKTDGYCVQVFGQGERHSYPRSWQVTTFLIITLGYRTLPLWRARRRKCSVYMRFRFKYEKDAWKSRLIFRLQQS